MATRSAATTAPGKPKRPTFSSPPAVATPRRTTPNPSKATASASKPVPRPARIPGLEASRPQPKKPASTATKPVSSAKPTLARRTSSFNKALSPNPNPTPTLTRSASTPRSLVRPAKKLTPDELVKAPKEAVRKSSTGGRKKPAGIGSDDRKGKDVITPPPEMVEIVSEAESQSDDLESSVTDVEDEDWEEPKIETSKMLEPDNAEVVNDAAGLDKVSEQCIGDRNTTSDSKDKIATEGEREEAEKMKKNGAMKTLLRNDSRDYNDVIEETASKLREQRINRVRALAGAFETVISLQDSH